MKTKTLFALAAITSGVLIPSAFAGVVYNDTITYINGAGNPNTGWVGNESDDILLGIRADNRATGATPNNGAGTYTFAPGLISGKADWNYQFTINSDPQSGTLALTTYNYYLTLSVNGVQLGTAVDVLAAFPDNTYGNNSSTQGNGVTVGTPATDAALAAASNVAANSESITFLGLPNNGGVYDFDLYAVAAGTGPNGTKLDDVSMEVQVVPEPTTIIAGISMLLPFGAGTLRMLRKKQTA